MTRGLLHNPLRMAAVYALAPAACGVIAMAATYQRALRNLGPLADDALVFVAAAGVVLAAPPLGLTGWLIGRAAARGLGLAALIALSAVLGFLLVGTASALWTLLGVMDGGPPVVLALAAAGGVAGLLTVLVVAALSGRARPQQGAPS